MIDLSNRENQKNNRESVYLISSIGSNDDNGSAKEGEKKREEENKEENNDDDDEDTKQSSQLCLLHKNCIHSYVINKMDKLKYKHIP